jgi:hypothetical protein
LRQADAIAPLFHIDAKIETEQAQIAHFELGAHLPLEVVNLSAVVPGDDEAIDVDTRQQLGHALTTSVHWML